jgi:hypothetical protein
MNADWANFFFAGWGLPFSLYVVAQVIALTMLRGRTLWFALLPIVPMAWVAYATAGAWAAQSNLWPIMMIFASPVAVVYVGAILIAAMIRRRRSKLPARR